MFYTDPDAWKIAPRSDLLAGAAMRRYRPKDPEWGGNAGWQGASSGGASQRVLGRIGPGGRGLLILCRTIAPKVRV